MEKKRINKYLSEVGFCSRRKADDYISAGRVYINGVKSVLGSKVNIDDEISEIQPKSDQLSPENLTTEEQLRMNFPDNETPIRNTLNQTDSDIHMFKGEGRYLALRNKGLFTEKSAPSSQTWV